MEGLARRAQKSAWVCVLPVESSVSGDSIDSSEEEHGREEFARSGIDGLCLSTYYDAS